MQNDNSHFEQEADYAARRFEDDANDRWQSKHSAFYRHRHSIWRWLYYASVACVLGAIIVPQTFARILLFSICLGCFFFAWIPVARERTQSTRGAILKTAGWIAVVLGFITAMGLLISLIIRLF